MPPPRSDFMNDLYLALFALVDQGHAIHDSSSLSFIGKKKPDYLPAFKMLLSLAEKDPAFDKNAQIGTTGLSLIQALLMTSRSHQLPLSWLMEWVDRMGVESVVKPLEGQMSLAEMFMETRVCGPLKGDEIFFPTPIFDIANWLVSHTPSEVLSEENRLRWHEMLESVAIKESDSLYPQWSQFKKDLIEPCSKKDDKAFLARSPLRWKRGVTSSEDISYEVIAPSGRLRMLSDLLMMNKGFHRDVEVSCSPAVRSALLPHKRRQDLVKHWIMASDEISVEDRRSRLWACLTEKPEVVMDILDIAEGTSRLAPLATQVLRTRDPKGRSFLAYASLRSRNEKVELFRKKFIDWLVNHQKVSLMDEACDMQGRGIFHQHMLSVLESGRGGSDIFYHNDALKEECGPSAWWAGPEKYRPEWIDMIVDSVLPNGSYETSLLVKSALELLDPSSLDAIRIEQAHLFAVFNKSMMTDSRLPQFFSTGGGAKSRNANNQIYKLSNSRHMAISELSEHLSRHDILLDIGEEEWRQWGLMGRSHWLESKGTAVFTPNIISSLVNLDKKVNALLFERRLRLTHEHVPVKQRVRI